MNTSIRHILVFAFTAPLFTLACTDTESGDSVRATTPLDSSEARLEVALRGLDRDDLIISYYEASSHAEMRVELEPFVDLARGFTVELLIDVNSPDGTNSRHELSWTTGDDEVPQIVMPAAQLGRYEMVLESVAIDGRVIDGLALNQVMRLRSEASMSEFEVLAPETSEAGNCGPGMQVNGTPASELLNGAEGRDGMYGKEGSDAMYGYACGDTLYGNQGNDTLRGGDGWDVCRGGDGFDSFVGCEDVIQ